jgi:hypothetical protein
MTQSTGTSNPNPIKWLEALVQQALARGKAAMSAVFALQNRAFALDTLDDQTAPSDVTIAAIECTVRGSGLFLVVVDWFGTLSGAGTAQIDIAEVQGPVTAFSGGTVEQVGGGTRKLPAVRYAKGGAITATSANLPQVVGTQYRTLSGGAATALTASAVVGLSGDPALQPQLILINETSGVDLTAQTLNLLAFEMP